MQHEFNYGDDVLEQKNLRRLDINPRNMNIKWSMDFCAQALREMIIGIGGHMDGFMMRSGFQITVSSEVMAILAVATSLADMRERMNKIVVAWDKKGNEVTTGDLEVGGAMTALMARAINPNLLQTVEGQPVLVHAGPFANIAIGQSSILADKVGLKLADYHITESGFGADIGFEKFWNLKCRFSGLTPNVSVIVATIRALKMHGGGPAVFPGRPLDSAYTESHPEYVEAGIENLVAHIETVRKAGVNPVVCLNAFYTDSDEEMEVVRKAAEAAGARFAVSKHWEFGGEGAEDFANVVVEACEEKPDFKFLYPDTDPLKTKIEKIATEVYGADGVTYSPTAEQKIKKVEADEELSKMGVCMVKTHLSLSHDPGLKGRPKGWTLPIQDVLTYRGAGFVVPVAGDIKLMPGTASDAAYRRIDVDPETGKVVGLF
jgi:formate--tetrahydrofolate ligase